MDYFIEPLDRLGKGGTGGARRHKVYERQVATGEHADRMTTSRYRHGKTKGNRVEKIPVEKGVIWFDYVASILLSWLDRYFYSLD